MIDVALGDDLAIDDPRRLADGGILLPDELDVLRNVEALGAALRRGHDRQQGCGQTYGRPWKPTELHHSSNYGRPLTCPSLAEPQLSALAGKVDPFVRTAHEPQAAMPRRVL